MVSGRATQRHRLALLALLASARVHACTRDKLLGLLWPESDTERARNLLNVSVYVLRHTLGENILLTDGDELRLDPAQICVDVIGFESALLSGDYIRAVALYSGPLLDGFFLSDAPEFEQWLDGERRRLAAAYAQALEAIAQSAEMRGDLAEATESWKRRAAEDPYDSRVALRLVQAFEAGGNPAGALQHASLHARLLHDHFGLQPSADLTQAVETIRARVSATNPSASSDTSNVSGVRSVRPRLEWAHDGSPPAPTPPPATDTQQYGNQIRDVRTSIRWSLAAGITAAVLLLIVVGTSVVRMARADSSRDTKSIVIADFVNRTSDPQLAAGINEALSIDLTQSNRIRVAAETSVGMTLKRMGQDTTKTLTDQLAREVALRDGFKAVLRGEVTAIGSAYVISAQLITPDSGRVLLSVREEAAGAQNVIAAVDRLSERLRKGMGDSMRGAHANQPLEAVTTRSLDALELYSVGARAARRANWDRNGGILARQGEKVISLYEQAIARDSMFAAAYRGLAVFLYWRGNQQARVDELLTRAYQLRTRLTEGERLMTEGTYYSFVTHQNERAIASFEQLLVRDPDNNTAIQHLAKLYGDRHDFARSIEMHERDWKERGGDPPLSYIFALIGAGRTARVDSLLRHLIARDSTGGPWHWIAAVLPAGRGDFRPADTLVPPMLRWSANGGPVLRSQADFVAGMMKLWRGGYADAVTLLRDAEHNGGPVQALKFESTLARADAITLHDSVRARRRLDDALATTPLQSLRQADRPYLEIAEAYAYAGEAKRAGQLLAAYRAVQIPGIVTEYPPAEIYTVDALVHAASGDFARAREILAEGERDLGCGPTLLKLILARAVVEERAGNQANAIRAWRSLVANPCRLGVFSEVLPVAEAHAHERLAQLHDTRGERKLAALHYARFLTLWPKADAVLQLRTRAAARRLAQLNLETSRETHPLH